MPLQLNTTEHFLKIVAITLNGRLDAFEAPALRKICDDYVSQGVNHFVFDLTDVSMLDSAGLAVLVSVLKRARLAEGDVRLIWPREEAAARILRLTKFDQVFTSILPEQIIPKGF
ncbi:MAG: STAS domain-containing protein [Chloroflexi bacterium]|nr:STAS domain-containing protein [Chloroflexota bacterium]